MTMLCARMCMCFRQKCSARASEGRRSRNKEMKEVYNCWARSAEILLAAPCQKHPDAEALTAATLEDGEGSWWTNASVSNELHIGQPNARRHMDRQLRDSLPCRRPPKRWSIRRSRRGANRRNSRRACLTACTRKVVGRSAPPQAGE